jgi:hypothetical protein
MGLSNPKVFHRIHENLPFNIYAVVPLSVLFLSGFELTFLYI